MKAVICTKYGEPDVLQIQEVKKPVPKDNEVLVKIKTTAVTASDCVIRGFNMPGNLKFPEKQLKGIMMRLFLGISKPRSSILGMVLAGEIDSIGNNITYYKVGDKVYGMVGTSFATYAEYKCISAKELLGGCISVMPSTMNFEEAAAVSYGATLALFFMGKADINAGDNVLIYGASGAIGTIAIQLAKSYGAIVTGVCSRSNIELVMSLGADKVIDYTDDLAHTLLETYDFILDAVGKNKTSELKQACKESLSQRGKMVSVDDGMMKQLPNTFDKLNDLINGGHVKAIIDSTYPLEKIVEAHRYVDMGHKKGNVIITIN